MAGTQARSRASIACPEARLRASLTRYGRALTPFRSRYARPRRSSFEPDRNSSDRVKRKHKVVLIRLNRDRRHHRAGDDHFACPQLLTEGCEYVRNMAYDVDPSAGVGLRIGGARELGATPHDAAGETIGRSSCAHWR